MKYHQHYDKSLDRFYQHTKLIMLKKIIYQRCTLNVARRHLPEVIVHLLGTIQYVR